MRKAHGRIDQHEITLCDVDPTSIGLPYIETVVRVRRTSSARTSPSDRLPGYYVSTEESSVRSPQQWLERIQGHWGGIEIRNHWRKDACLLEDKTRSRNPNIVAVMAMLRSVLMLFLAEDPHTSNINAFTEAFAADSNKVLDRVTRSY